MLIDEILKAASMMHRHPPHPRMINGDIYVTADEYKAIREVAVSDWVDEFKRAPSPIWSAIPFRILTEGEQQTDLNDGRMVFNSHGTIYALNARTMGMLP